MERFKRAMGQRFQPVAAVHATRECDAVVRTTTSFETLAHALAAHGGCRFVPAPATHPPAWQDAVSRLEGTLCTPSARPDALVDAYAAELEACTASAAHDFLATPLTRVTAAWVSQPQLNDRLHSLSQHPTRLSESERPAPIHIVLVARRGSRQDDAASDPAAAAARAVGAADVHLLRLGEKRGPHTVAAVADAIVAALHEELASRTEVLSEAARRLRRASHSAFRSWFGGPPTATATLRQLQPLPGNGGDASSPSRLIGNTASRLSLPGRSSSPSETARPGQRSRHRRRGSFGGDIEHTPLFDPDSLEAVSRQLADLQMLVGRYEEAVEGYRLLVNDFRGLTGAARVHEAAALEMLALGMALIDGSKLEVGRTLEKAVSVYVASGRRELAVRTAFRVFDYCISARSSESAGPVLVRAITAIFSNVHNSAVHPLLPETPSSFLDGAAGVLHGRAALALTSSRKARRAALHSFLAAGRLSKLNLYEAAATFVKIAHPGVLVWKSVEDEYELVLGQSEMVEGSALRAAHHFTRILANATSDSDVELQSSVVRHLSAAVGKGAVDGMLKNWNSGAKFPQLVGDSARVCTNDSHGEVNEEWRSAEDEVLIDFEYFEHLRTTLPDGKAAPNREKPVNAVISELRKQRDLKDPKNPGGSLENKIRRIREKDVATRKRRRARSLLERCSVLGEDITISVTLRNPLHFPVLVNDMTPVVTLDGTCFSALRADEKSRSHQTGRSPFRKERSGRKGFNEEDPTFPVEFLPVDEIVLGPRSEHDIGLKIFIHKQGVLRVIGAQWLFTVGMGDSRSRASSQIPGYAVLERQGKRLNETRHQRACEIPMYEPDRSLALEITAPAPRIRINLHDLEITSHSGNDGVLLRAGEMKKASLSLRNEGTVAAKGVVFRIDTPDTLFMNAKDFGSPASALPLLEGLEKVQLLDESGKLAGNGAPVVAGFLPVCLEPGAEASGTVWLRASVPISSLQAAYGKTRPNRTGSELHGVEHEGITPSCAFSMTFAYGETRARVSRLTGLIFARPSVFVSRRFMTRTCPSALPSSEDHGGVGITLGVEVEHSARSPGDTPIFRIECMSVTSTHSWQLSALPPKAKSVAKEVGVVANKSATLRANETATLFVVLHSKDVHGSATSPWSTDLLNFAVDADDAASPTSISQTLTVDNVREIDPFDWAAKHFVLANQMRTFGPAMALSNNLACIAVRWQDTLGARGELYLQPLDLYRWLSTSRPPSTMHTRSSSFVSLSGADPTEKFEEETREIMRRIAEEAPALRVSVKHKEHLAHQFTRITRHGSIAVPAVVSVKVYIKNISHRLLDVNFAAAPHSGIADGDRGRCWAGDIAMSLRALAPDSERFLQLTAILERPGKYNMAHFLIKYQISLMKQSQKKISFEVEPSFLTVDEVQV